MKKNLQLVSPDTPATVISDEHREKLYQLVCALDGLRELTDDGEERQMNCRNLHALLEPISTGLLDLYCEMINPEMARRDKEKT
jgi:hypothetical protein